MTSDDDLDSLISAEHEEIDGYLRRLDDLAGGTSEAIPRLVAALTDRLNARSTVWAERIYPLARAGAVDGPELVEEQLAEQSEMDHSARRLSSLPPSDGDYWSLAHELMRQVRQQLHIERHELLPRLREVCTDAELADLLRNDELEDG